MRKHNALPHFFWLSATLIFLFTTLDALLFIYPIMGQLWLHISLCITLVALSIILGVLQADLRFLVPFNLFMITLGPPGAFVIAGSLLLYLIDRFTTQSISSLLGGLFPSEPEDSSDRIYDRLIYHLDDPRPSRIPIPFKDIMLYGNYNQKRMAIEKMLRYFRPEFAGALKLGLTDKSSAVKVQTATALSYIDHQMFDHFLQLKAKWEEEPENTFALKLFAEYGGKYALSEILDPDRLSMVLDEVIQVYKEYIKRQPHDMTARIALATLYLKNENPQEAKEVLEGVLAIKFRADAAELLMQTLFSLNQTQELIEFANEVCSQLKDRKQDDPTLMTATLWAKGVHPNGI